MTGDGTLVDPGARALLDDGARIGMLATTRRDGGPWVQPLWYALDSDDVVIVVLRDSISGRALVRERRAALCVSDDALPYRFASLECSAETSRSDEEAARWLRTLMDRYMPGAPDAERRVAEYLELGVYVTRLKILRVTYRARVMSG
jgi:PPOX class probable F420-dependent enzyme